MTAPFLTRDTGLAILRVEGGDATTFLNAQVATALEREGNKAACPAALANPKGRVLAVFHAWPTRDGWHIAIAESQIEWLQNHLERFVFRSKVRITPAQDLELLGVAGSQAGAALAAAGLPTPGPGQITHAGEIAVIGLVGKRWLIAGDPEVPARVMQTLEEKIRSGNFEDWTRMRVAAGEAEIRNETRGRFLPQMLNLVELDAVSFRKGCYPGQEVIARARRGNVKRGLVLAELEEVPDKPIRAGDTLEYDGRRLEILDGITLPDGRIQLQAVTTR